MRIAMIGQKGIPAKFGGVERHVHDLALHLTKYGYDITIYSRFWYIKHKLSSIDGIKIVRLPSIRTKHLDTITHTLLATIHAIRGKYDIIHYHGVGPSLWSWLPRIFSPDSKIITTFHSIDRKHEKWGLFARMVLKFGEWTTCRIPHHTIAVSNTIKQYIRDVYDREATFIPNAICLREKTKKDEYLAVWGLKPKSYILMVSRLIPHKGAHYLIEAYNKLSLDKDFNKNIKLVIVGEGYYTGLYVRFLQELAKGNKNIIFTGFQSGDALEQLYSHAKFMVHPSDKEGIPITVLEAMSYALPILLSDIPEHIELIDNHNYLFARGQILSLKERIHSLTKKDTLELNNEGNINRARAENKYNWDTVIREIIDLYEKTRACQTQKIFGKTVNC